MPLEIQDSFLQQTGLTDEEARLEFAYVLCQVGKLSLGLAAEWVGLSLVEMERELAARGKFCQSTDDGLGID